MGMLLRRYYKQAKPAEVADDVSTEKTLKELKAEAKEKGIKGYSKMTEEELEQALKG